MSDFRALVDLQFSADGTSLVGKSPNHSDKNMPFPVMSAPRASKQYFPSTGKENAMHLQPDWKYLMNTKACSTVNASVQTDITDTLSSTEVTELLTSAEPNETYWKMVAESKAKALRESVEENEELHILVESLSEENDELRSLLQEANAMVSAYKRIAEDDSGFIEGCVSTPKRQK